MLNDKIPLHEEEWFEKLAIKIFSDIGNLTKDKIGISRESYGRGETLGINYLIDLAEAGDEKAILLMMKWGYEGSKAFIGGNPVKKIQF